MAAPDQAEKGGLPGFFGTVEESNGLLAALGAFVLWGLSPIYFKWMSHISPFEVISHRVIWSSLFVLLLVMMMRKTRQLIAVFRDRRKLLVFLVTTVLIGSNWLTYIWAIANNHILEASLGYYINPLVNVLLGMLFLKERLNRWQTVAILLAVAAVAIMTVQMGYLPWVSLYLAFSFGFYGLLRKNAPVDSAVGLVVETTLLMPFALGFLIYLTLTPVSAPLPEFGGHGFFYDGLSYALLIGTGIVTAVPLLLFSVAAKRLKLTTVGLMQYLAPTIQMVLAIYIYDEPFDSSRLVAFALIWLGLIVYSVDGLRGRRKARRAMA